jgi:hypothetical protein
MRRLFADASARCDVREAREGRCLPLAGRLRAPIAETRRLNLVLRSWFDSVELYYDDGIIRITAQPRLGSSAGLSGQAAEWAPSYAARRVVGWTRRSWTNTQIEEALRAWTAKYGDAPHHWDWTQVAVDHPASSTVFRRYHGWGNALRAAGLAA